MEKVGIDNLKLVISFIFNLFDNITESLEDGKITFWEGLKLIPELKEIGQFIPLFKSIKSEIRDLDNEEAQQLNHYIKERFNMTSSEVDLKIEYALDWVVATYALYNTCKNK